MQKNNRLNIGIEAQRIFRAKKGGMDVVAIELIKNLALIDTVNNYYIFAKPGEEQPWELPLNFKWILTKNFPYPIWEQLYLPYLVKRYKLDMLHCTSNTAPIFPRTKLLLTLHDIIFLENLRFMRGSVYQRFGNLYRKFIVPLVVRKCSQIFTVSVTEKNNLVSYFKHLKANKIKIVYNGINSAFFADETLKNAQIKSIYKLPDNYIFFLGNTDPKKNITNVLKAVKLLSERYGLKINLVITNYSQENLSKLLKINDLLSIESQLFLTGYVQYNHLPALYAQSNGFLYPSLREGFGLPILEAQTCKIPVITSNISCMPEIAGNGAIYCDPYSIESISKAIMQLTSDKTIAANCVENGIENAKKFSWKKMAETVHHFYMQ